MCIEVFERWCGATKALDEVRDVASDVNMRWWVKRELEIEVSSLILFQGEPLGERRRREEEEKRRRRGGRKRENTFPASSIKKKYFSECNY